MARTLFVTPDFTSDDYQCRTLRTPNNAEWLGVFNKALLLMKEPYNWEQINATDLTVDDTITLVTSILDEFWSTPNCGEGCTLPDLDSPPFRLGMDGHFEMLDPATGEWGPPTGEYEIPPVTPREESTEEERLCAAAANAAHVMELLYEAITDEIALGGDALQVAAAMVAALVTAVGGWIAAPVYAIIQLSIALFAGMIELLQVLGSDVWTTEFNDRLKCALYDCATDTGDIVTFDLTCIREQLSVEPDIFSPTWFYEIQLFAQIVFLMETITMDGLNAAGATTAITGAECDCEDTWCHEFDLTETDGGFTAGTAPECPSGWLADWHSGSGWGPEIGQEVLCIEKEWTNGTDTYITHVGAVFTNSQAGVGYDGITMNAYEGSTQVETWFNGDTNIDGGIGGDITANHDLDRVMIVANFPVPGYENFRLTHFYLKGIGENPFGDTNCE